MVSQRRISKDDPRARVIGRKRASTPAGYRSVDRTRPDVQTTRTSNAEIMLGRITPGVKPFNGAVAVGVVRQAGELGDDMPKPVVICRWVSDGSPAWAVWGLTLNRYYRTGGERTAATGLHLVGFDEPGFVWSSRLAYLPDFDIRGVIWPAPRSLLHACAATGTGIPGWESAEAWAEATHRSHVAAGWTWPKP